MAASELLRVFDALSQAQVRYLVVGGVAVVLHGHMRVTADLDLVVDLSPDNALACVRALAGLGYQPRVPVPVEQFADAAARQRWIEDKAMTVFSLWSKQSPGTEIDLFVREPFAFDETYARAVQVELDGVAVKVIGLQDLIALKRAVGRSKDLEDAAALAEILEEEERDGRR